MSTKIKGIFSILFLTIFSLNNFSFSEEIEEGSSSLLLHHFFNQTPNIKLIKEFEGDFIVRGRSIFYSKKDIEIKVGDIREVSRGGIVEEKVSLCEGVYKDICEISLGVKRDINKHLNDFPKAPIYSVLFNLKDIYQSEFNKNSDEGSNIKEEHYLSLLPFVLASPNQEDAGSCLYMATTGAMELLMNQSANNQNLNYDGEADLSERFLMNVTIPSSPNYRNWRTDTILIYNNLEGALLNRDYRYTKGWFKHNNQGNVIRSVEGAAGASYGASYNWIDELNGNSDLKSKLVKIPSVNREIIYEDPKGDQWNVGGMSTDTILKIKEAMKRNNGPAILLYNHYGYWHAILLVGYDDQKAIDGCSFVNSFVSQMGETIKELVASSDPSKLKQAEKYKTYLAQIEKAKSEQGGCSSKGVFYIRDSIYNGVSEPKYDYDLNKVGEETLYSKRIIEKSYDFVKYLGNHAYVIFKK